MGLFLLTACGGDDSVGGAVNPPGGGTTVNGKRLVAIKEGNQTTPIEYNSTGQVIKFGNTEYFYEGNSIRRVNDNKESVFNLNNGRIVEGIIPNQLNSTLTTVQQLFEYDNSGYLVKVNYYESGRTSTTYGFNIEEFTGNSSFVWQTQNNTKTTTNMSGNSNTAYFKGTSGSSSECTRTFTNHPNSIPFMFFSEQALLIEPDYVLSWQGYFGNRCVNLPAKEIIVEKQWSTNIATPDYTSTNTNKIEITYSYTFENGLLIMIQKTAVHDNGGNALTYNYKYQLVWE